MTFQEAQARFTGIVQTITPGLSSAELVQKQAQLQGLLNSLPNSVEFDPLANAIAEFSPKLAGQVTQAVLADLQSRDASLQAAAGLLNRVENRAQADARTLRLEQPKMIVATLTESVTTLEQIRNDVQAGNLQKAVANTEALLSLVNTVRTTIKSV
jgi:hypothetical protein